jgi:hypothetical protein
MLVPKFIFEQCRTWCVEFITARSLASTGDEIAITRSRLPLMERSSGMKRRRFKQDIPPKDRLADWAKGVRQQAAECRARRASK